MTEKELIEMAKKDWHKFRYIDKSLITKNVVENIGVENRSWYHNILEGINPECISKEKALQFLKYDKEMYGLLTPELQKDTEILEATISDLYKLPKSLFNNKDGINYLLDKYNIEGKSWAVYDVEKKGLVIKRDITIKKYIFYFYGRLQFGEDVEFDNEFHEIKHASIDDEVFQLTVGYSDNARIIIAPKIHLD